MKIYKPLVAITCLMLLMNACQKEALENECNSIYGCIDSTAFNYNPEASYDDGSCEPLIVGCTDVEALNYNELANTDDGLCGYTYFNIIFNTIVNGEQFVLNDILYDDYLGRKYRVELLKFYLSNWTLEKQDGTMFPIADIALVDYSSDNSLSIDAIIDTGIYVNIHFGVGLDPLMNASDPVDFQSSHPLSVSQNTYWSWASKYKFFMIEGRVDTLGGENPNAIFSYHTGFDILYREITVPLQDMFIGLEGDSAQLEMDLAQVINGDAGLVDFVEDPFSHSETDFEIVEIISNNLLNAFSINE